METKETEFQWNTVKVYGNIEAHDPGIVTRSGWEGAADRSELKEGMNLKDVIKEESWEHNRGYFSVVWLHQMRPDGVTVRVGERLIEIPAGQCKTVLEEGLSYAVGYISVRVE